MSDTWTCQRCGRSIVMSYLSHVCSALSETHVSLPSEPAVKPAAELARLRASVERLAEEWERPSGEPHMSDRRLLLRQAAARLRALLADGKEKNDG